MVLFESILLILIFFLPICETKLLIINNKQVNNLEVFVIVFFIFSLFLFVKNRKLG